jgi:hypothetical protein
MAREICFCGWVGEVEDREPVYAGAGEWGLRCPMCGHVDRLEDWSEAARAWTLAEAARRRERTVESSSQLTHCDDAPSAASRSISRSRLQRDDL